MIKEFRDESITYVGRFEVRRRTDGVLISIRNTWWGEDRNDQPRSPEEDKLFDELAEAAVDKFYCQMRAMGHEIEEDCEHG